VSRTTNIICRFLRHVNSFIIFLDIWQLPVNRRFTNRGQKAVDSGKRPAPKEAPVGR